MLKLFNTLTRKVETFKPIKKDKVGLYTCGPTVYNYVHIGNWRSYVFADLLRRYLEYSGFQVKHIMNLTDVEDKIIRDSQKKGKTLKQFTEFYTDAFFKDMKSLNIKRADVTPKATEHIDEMVEIVKKLKSKNHTYEADKSIYFKISTFPNYGELAQLSKQDLKQNAEGRLNLDDEYDKEDVGDFVLWKAWRSEDGKVYWETEIGKGRPGWHIECSAMSMKYLGESFDIHTGGVDLVFPHHTNEIAQSEGATGKRFVNYWLHHEHLLVGARKMSKSFGNFYTLRDLQEKKHNALLFRLILLKTHYRKILNFTFEDFKQAKAAAERLLDFLISLDLVKRKKKNDLKIDEKIEKSRNGFKEAMDNDLNTSSALTSVFDLVSEINKSLSQLNVEQAQKIKKYILEVDSVLGFIETLHEQYKKRLKKLTNDKDVKKLLRKRTEIRKEKDYEKADQIRQELFEKGIVVQDIKDGHNVRLINLLE